MKTTKMQTTDMIVLSTNLIAQEHVQTPISYAQWAPTLRKLTKSIDMELHDQNRRAAADGLMKIIVMAISMLEDLGYHRDTQVQSQAALSQAFGGVKK